MIDRLMVQLEAMQYSVEAARKRIDSFMAGSKDPMWYRLNPYWTEAHCHLVSMEHSLEGVEVVMGLAVEAEKRARQGVVE